MQNINWKGITMLDLERKSTDAVKILTDIMKGRTDHIECQNRYQGITHGVPDKLIMDESFCIRWKKERCSNGIHLWDEVLSDDEHYLSCDVCNLVVNIRSIDKSWVEDEDN
jgi:hypothetical protein